MYFRFATLSAAAALALGSGYAPQANAVSMAANATAFCQTALPVFDGNVRKRPLAVTNEGTSNAFISCSIPKGPDSTGNT